MPTISKTLMLAGALAAAMLLSPAASGQAIAPGEEGALADFAPPRDGARACFARTYDAAHLKSHPDQKVTAMRFRIAYYVHEPDEFFPKGQRNYYFQLQTKLRGDARDLSAGGECVSTPDGKAISCGVECDGGGVLVTRRAKPGQILVDLREFGRLRMTESCDEEEDAVELEPGKDDRTFLLEAEQSASCPTYDDW